MTKRTFIFMSMAAGVVAFFIFRSYTHPLETALHWLLLSAFLGSSLLSSIAFSMLWQHVRSRWVRLVSVPGFLAAFIVVSGFGVFAATHLVFESRQRDADSGAILYASTSGMQMLTLDRDLWFHVIVAVALPLLLLSALGAITAFTGIDGSRVKQRSV